MKVAMEVAMVRSQTEALEEPDAQKGHYMKSALLLSQTKALEEETDAAEQERNGFEVDCGKQSLALNFPTFSKFLKFRKNIRHCSKRSTNWHHIPFWCRLHTVLLPREAENVCA